MNSDFWLYYWQQIKYSNYTITLVVLSQIIALIFTLIYWRKETANKLILLYNFYGLFLFTIGFYLRFINQSSRMHLEINESLNILFSTIELYTFTYILEQSLSSKYFKNINHILRLFYLGLIPMFALIFNFKNFDSTTKRYLVDSITFIEISYIGILILNYYINIFTSSPRIDLKKSPTFWICSFLLLYTLGFPLIILLIEHYRHNNKEIFQILVSLHYLSLSLVYIGITKAILCKKTLTS